MSAAKDYIAIILIGGGSSWARDPDPERAIARVAKIFKSDWKSLFKLDGVEVRVNLWDVTGNESVHWDDCGMHGDCEADHPITRVETRSVTLSGKQKVAA